MIPPKTKQYVHVLGYNVLLITEPFLEDRYGYLVVTSS